MRQRRNRFFPFIKTLSSQFAIFIASLSLSGLLIRIFFAESPPFLFIVSELAGEISRIIFNFTIGLPITVFQVDIFPQFVKDLSFSYFLLGSALLNAVGPTFNEVTNNSGGTFQSSSVRLLSLQKLINKIKDKLRKTPRLLHFIHRGYFYFNMYVLWPIYIIDMVHDPWVVRWRRDDGWKYRLIIPRKTEYDHAFDRVSLLNSIRGPFVTRLISIFGIAAILLAVYVGIYLSYRNPEFLQSIVQYLQKF